MDFNTVCTLNMCTGCNACVQICKNNAVHIVDDGIALNAVINNKQCIDCNMCRKVCLNSRPIEFVTPIEAKQGWILEESYREKSASGGAAQAIMMYCLEQGYVVYSCANEGGRFIIRRVGSGTDLDNFVGSKYVKSDTANSYQEIYLSLQQNQKVLFIGLPCQVQGLKNYVGKYLIKGLITVDLICHGTPSQELFKMYAEEQGYVLGDISQITFRKKKLYRLNIEKNSYDYWTNPFMKGLTYTENCYNCKFARYARVSDFTIGDSWGSKLPEVEQNKGVSLILCNSKKAIEILSKISFHCEYVDVNNAVNNNEQLRKPSMAPDERQVYLKILRNTKNYHKAVFRCYWRQILRISATHSLLGKLLKKVLEGDKQKM